LTPRNAALWGLAPPAEKNRLLTWIISAIFSLVATVVFTVSPARAGDFAQPAIIGYSKDLRYFAFEEYGIADPSGFPYSSIYFIDLKDNSLVSGTPVKVRLDKQVDPLAGELVRARAIARQKAQAWINKLKINWPAQMLAYNGDGAPDLDGGSLRFGTTGYNGAVIGDFRLDLEMVDAGAVLECESWAASNPQGFVLTIVDYDFQKKEIYRNQPLPDSKNCPLYYKISGVFAPFAANDISDAVALISVYSAGWEGEDRRFVVVPIGQAMNLK